MEDLNTFLYNYFAREIEEGKTEFRLKVTKSGLDIDILVHPQGKNGETIDLRLELHKNTSVWLTRK